MNKEISYQERHEKEKKNIKYAVAGFLGLTAILLASGNIAKHYTPEPTPNSDNTESAIDILYDVTIGDEFNKVDEEYQDDVVKEAIIKHRLEQQSESKSVDEESINVKG